MNGMNALLLCLIFSALDPFERFNISKSCYALSETCDCPAVMTSTFQILPPYVLRKPDGKVGGIIPELIERMTSSCCTTCPSSMVTFDKDGQGEISEQETYPDLLSSIHESTTFTFPMMGYPSSKTYSSHFGFIPGVEAPGMIVMVKKQSAASISLTVLKSVFGLWPILVVNILLALIAGIVMWMLVGIAFSLEYNLHRFFTY